MTRTVAQASQDYRKRKAEKLERWEKALREIATTSCPRIGEDPFAVLARMGDISRAALNPDTQRGGE